MTQPQKKEEKCEHKNKRRWTMDLESGTRCDDCGADLSLKLSVSQQQLSVRERAREMFDEKFLWGNCCQSCIDDKSEGYGDDIESCCCQHQKIVNGQYKIPSWLSNEIKTVIDQIITLAQEEKIKLVEQLTHNETGLMPEMGIFDSGYELAKEDVIKILKQ